MKTLFTLLTIALLATTSQAAPKKLLIVSTTTGFRHTSIPLLEQMLAKLGQESGEFTVDYIHQPPDKPVLKKDPTPEDRAVFKPLQQKWEASLTNALQKLS